MAETVIVPGFRRLAVAVLLQALKDASSGRPEERAAACIWLHWPSPERDFWLAVAGIPERPATIMAWQPSGALRRELRAATAATAGAGHPSTALAAG